MPLAKENVFQKKSKKQEKIEVNGRENECHHEKGSRKKRLHATLKQEETVGGYVGLPMNRQ
jgi:hypothetical protein